MHTSIDTISQWSRKQDSLTVSPFTTVRPDVIKKVQRGIVTNRRRQSLKFLLTLLPSVLRSLAMLITFMCTLISLLLHIYSKLNCPNISARQNMLSEPKSLKIFTPHFYCTIQSHIHTIHIICVSFQDWLSHFFHFSIFHISHIAYLVAF